MRSPHHTQFVIENGIVGKHQWHLTFEMDGEIPKYFVTTEPDKKTKYSLTIKAIGREAKLSGDAEDPDAYFFIAEHNGHQPRKKSEPHHWFYVGKYNTRTGRGECVELDGRKIRKQTFRFYKTFNATSNPLIISSGSSNPNDNLKNPSVIPSDSLISFGKLLWLINGG